MSALADIDHNYIILRREKIVIFDHENIRI